MTSNTYRNKCYHYSPPLSSLLSSFFPLPLGLKHLQPQEQSSKSLPFPVFQPLLSPSSWLQPHPGRRTTHQAACLTSLLSISSSLLVGFKHIQAQEHPAISLPLKVPQRPLVLSSWPQTLQAQAHPSKSLHFFRSPQQLFFPFSWHQTPTSTRTRAYFPPLPAFTATGGAAPDAAGGGQHQRVLHPLPPRAVQVGQVKLRPVRRALALRGEQTAGVAPGEAAAPARSQRHTGKGGGEPGRGRNILIPAVESLSLPLTGSCLTFIKENIE